jgi:hypothetical protein
MWDKYCAGFRPQKKRNKRISLKQKLQHYLFCLIQAHLVASAVIELGRPGTFVGGALLGVLDRAAVLQVGGDPRRPKCRIAQLGVHPASRARRLMIPSASRSLRPLAVSLRLWPRVVRNRGDFSWHGCPPHRDTHLDTLRWCGDHPTGSCQQVAATCSALPQKPRRCRSRRDSALALRSPGNPRLAACPCGATDRPCTVSKTSALLPARR